MRSDRSAPLLLLPLLLLAVSLALPAPPGRSGAPGLWPAAVLAPATPGAPPDAVPGELIVKFRPAASLRDKDDARGRVQGSRRRRFRMGAEHWVLPPGTSVPKAIDSLRADPRVAWVEPNYRLHALVMPDDPRYPEQWALHNTGQDQGTPGADIRAETAWDSGTGSRDVVVAVIDTGIDYTHPDLAGNIWDNEGEIAGNGIDDDGNGFVDDVRGWDFVNGDDDPMDDAGHGTHVAGILGAAGGNHDGIAGIAWQVRLMPVKFLGADGGGSTADAVAAVEYATRMGARIMNNSWGGNGFSQALLDAIEEAAAADALFVVAAGNSGTNNDLYPTYPASYDVPNILSVAATDRFDHLAGFSNYGAGSVDLAAPGVEILSTVPGARYAVHSGTSMATPHVSGVAALVRAAAPTIDVATLRRRLLTQVDPVPGLQGAVATGGRLNAGLAVASPDTVPPAPITDLQVTATGSNTVTLRWTATGDDGREGTAQSYDLRYATFPIDADTFDEATPFAGVPAPRPSGAEESVELTGLEPSTEYAIALRARDEWGNPGALGEPVVATTLPPPRLDTAPKAFAADLRTGESVTRGLTILNAGEGTLDWVIPPPRIGPAGPALLGVGGPDPFGYRFIDSDEPAGPVFAWTDLRIDGTDAGIAGDDSTSAAIPIGFPFPFYEDHFDTVRICSNGFLSFTSSSTPYANQPLPNQAAPENLVAPFWDDLFLIPTSKVVYRRDPGRFQVQYDGVMHYDGSGPDTFQVELRDTGEIEFRYRRLEGTRVSASIGIQDGTRSRGLQIAFNAPYLHDDLAVHIDAVPQWLSASPARGRLGPLESTQVVVGIDAAGLPGGIYEGSVLVLSNDPEAPRREHPVTLRVTDAPAIAVAPPLVDFGTVFAGFASQQVVTIRNTGTTPLTVAAAGATAPSVSAVGAPLTVEPAAAADLTVIWSPTGPAALDATLMITSDASNRPLLQLPLRGAAITPPSIGVTPAAFVETLDSGSAAARTLTLTNAGPTGLDFHLRALSGPAGISAGSSAAIFDRLSDSPAPVTCLAGDPGSGLIYCEESQGSGFLRHRLSAGTWEPLAPAPFGNGEDAGAALLNGRLYTGWAGRNSQIGVFDLAARSWSTRANPLGLGTAAIASDGVRWIYFIGSNSFVRYDPATGLVENLPGPPFVFGFRGGLRFLEGTLYGHAGGGSTAFARYDVALARWQTLAPIPGGGGLGAAIDPWSREYATAASGGRGVARYAFEADAWTITAVPLFATGDGGLAWMSSPAPGLVITQGRDGRRCARLSTAPGFLTLGATTGRVPGAGATVVPVRLDTAGLTAGDHRAAILVESNDPRAPAVTVPVTLTVLGAPDLRLLGDTVTIESTQSYSGAGASTAHTLTLADPPGGGASLSILAEGDYGDAGERAAVGVEGIDLGAAGGSGTDCTAATATFPLSDAQLAALAADVRVEATVRNSPDVGDLCGLNRHTVRLSYAAAVDRIEFGTIYTGSTGGRAVVLTNQGTAPLRVDSITAEPANFAPATPSAALAPGESLRLEVRLTPAAAGPIEGTLRIASDDPDQPLLMLPLTGTGTPPPRALVDPPALETTLRTNQETTARLTLSNAGAGPLHYSVEGRAAADAPGCQPTRLLVTQNQSGTLSSVDLLTGAVAPLAFGLVGPIVGIDVDPRAGIAYVTEPDAGTVDAIDLITGAVRVVAAGFSYPSGVALDAARQRLYVSDGAAGTIEQIDLPTGARAVRASGLAANSDLAIAPGGGALYVADTVAGRLLRMETSTGALTTLAFGLGTVEGLDLDPEGNQVFVTVSEPGPGRLLAIDLASGGVRLVATGLVRPAGVALSPARAVAWVAETGPDRVTAVDLATGALSVAAPVPSDPAGLALQPDPRCRVDFLGVTPPAGTVPPGGAAAIDVRVDAAGLGSGSYDGLVAIATDDPTAPSIPVPVRLTVAGAPDLEVAGEEVRLESTANYFGTGAVTTHDFTIAVPPGGGATILLDADGDFGAAGETATLEVEGTILGAAGGVENDCQPAHATLALATAPLAAAAADGVLHVVVRNSADVNQVCLVSRHTVRVIYNAPGGRIDFAPERIGSTAVRSLILFNRGTDPLDIASITTDLPAFAVAAGSFRIDPGERRAVEVRFAPTAVGPVDGALTIASNDSDEPEVMVPLQGSGRIAPEAVAEPSDISADLSSDQTTTRVVRLRNVGGSDLTFAARFAPSGGTDAPGPGPATTAGGEVPDVLLIQDVLPWESDTDAQALGMLGFPFVRSTAGGLAGVDLSRYRLILVAGDQRTTFYAALAPAMPRLAAWVAGGGVLEFHAAAWGAHAGDASAVVLPRGVRIERASSPTNQVILANHPLTAEVPGSFTGQWASHAHFRSVPADATRLAVDDAGVDTLVYYRHGVGAVIATGQPIEFYRAQSNPVGAILRNAIVWARGTLLPSWVDAVPASGVLPPGGEASILLTLRDGALPAGAYGAALALSTNDPARPLIGIPVTLGITGPPRLRIDGEEQTIISSSAFTGVGETVHALVLPLPASGGAWLTVAVTGGFGQPSEYAEVTVEGTLLGRVGGQGIVCGTTYRTFFLTPEWLATLAADGVVRAVVQNSHDVDTFCGTSRHALTLTYNARSDQIDFGSLQLGVSAARRLIVANAGSTPLSVAITADRPEFTVTPAAGAIPAGGRMEIETQFIPVRAGVATGALTVTSDDPSRPSASVTLAGTAVGSPGVSIDPVSIEGTYYPGLTDQRTLRLSNPGDGVLTWHAAAMQDPGDPAFPRYLDLTPPSGTLPPGGFVDLITTFRSAGLSPGVRHAFITVASNFAARPRFDIPVTLTVLAGGRVALNLTPVDFGGGFIGVPKSRTVSIGNIGNSDLRIDAFIDGPPAFTVQAPNLTVPPGGTGTLGVQFLADAAGAYEGTLRLTTDDPLQTLFSVPLRATASESGHLGVLPGSLETRLPQGQAAELTVSILNSGEVPLTFTATPGAPPAWCPGTAGYVTERTTGGIFRMSLPTGDMSPVVIHQMNPRLGIAVTSETHEAWVTDFNAGRLVEVDLLSRAVKTSYSEFLTPLGLALDRARHLAYVGEYNPGIIFAVDLSTGGQAALADGLPMVTGLALAPGGNLLYAATETGRLYAIDTHAEESPRLLRSDLNGPWGLAVSGDGLRAYVVETQSGAIGAIDLLHGSYTRVSCCLAGATGIALDSDDRRAWVTGSGHVYSLDLTTGVVQTVSIQAVLPAGIAMQFDTACTDRYLGVTPPQGSVPAHDVTDVTVRITTVGLPLGTQQAWIDVASNDPVHPMVRVPITVLVLGDLDRDGALDDEDNCPEVPNADQADGDGDRRGDLCDFCPAVSDPEQGDFDHDGIGDLCDACTDRDRDGRGDPGLPNPGCALDNCPDRANPAQADADIDGLGDECDPCTDPDHDGFRTPGFPGDGCPIDDCPAVPDPEQVDTDRDRRGDACDPCPLDAFDDVDGDGRCAEQDNCPLLTNPLQENRDGDPYGDACDNCPDVGDPDQGDLDHDGRGDACDDCPTLPDAGQEDLDGDGVGDRCDNCVTAANPDQSDRNHDQSGDACQPEVMIESVRADSDPIVVHARAVDPQGDALAGDVALYAGFGGKVLLTDALGPPDCAQAWLPDNVIGRGIGFANDSVNLPALFDADYVIGCENFTIDWMLAAGPCAAPTTYFDVVLPLEGLPLPAPVCIRDAHDERRMLDLTVLSYDGSHLSLSYHGEGQPSRSLFAGRFPTGIDLTGFPDEVELRLQITVTDGVTPPVFAETTFARHGARLLTFGDPPVASIAAAPTTECDAPDGGLVRLDGRGSTDPDAPPGPGAGIARFEWREDPGGAGERALGEGAVLDIRLGLGPHRIGLRVIDQDGDSGETVADVQVADTAAPAIACPVEVVAECGGPEGAVVALQASAHDACGGATVVNDRGPGGAAADGTYPLGATTVTFAATDAAGQVATCASRVVVRDTLAPTLTLRADPANLWPANRRMVPVTVTWQSADLCTAAPAVTLVSVESSDPDVTGPGDRPGDIEGAVAGQPVDRLALRAERLLTGPARIYTLRYVAKDAAGNAGPGVATVVVKSAAPGAR